MKMPRTIYYGFLIVLAFALLLGYFYVLVVYVHRLDTPSQHDTHQDDPFYEFKTKGTATAIIRQPRLRLDAKESRHQMEEAQQTVPPVVQSIEGVPLANWTAMDHNRLAVEDDTVRAKRVIYIITPTHGRITQMVDLVRFQQTLQLVAAVHHRHIYWIIVEDAEACSGKVRKMAEESGLPFAHKATFYKKKRRTLKNKNKKDKNDPGPHRGLLQRNLGLDIVLEVGKEGVVYFADDDNGYHVQLFTELLYTQHASIFAVGLSGGSAYERCHVNEATGKVDAILSTWKPKYRVPVKNKPGTFTNPERKFGIDMAGFAFSTAALVEKKPRFDPQSTAGMLETDFLSMLVQDISDLEPLAANCTRILVWHVKTTEPQYFGNPESSDRTFELIKSLV